MSWIDSTLTRIERRLSELIEGDHATQGITPRLHHQLEQELVAAMQAGAHTASSEYAPSEALLSAPDEYTVILPTSQAQLLLLHPQELNRLSRQLVSAAARMGNQFAVEPTLRVVAAPGATHMKVLAAYSQGATGHTGTMELDGALGQSSPAEIGHLPKAFLIINGLTTYPLIQPVVNVGRDATNQVQLDDPRVSRLHAQLRLIHGRFVIFDLDSLGGTFVNDVAVSRHVLNPGDVIQLAGVPVVFGQEQVILDGHTQEVPIDPPLPELL